MPKKKTKKKVRTKKNKSSKKNNDLIYKTKPKWIKNSLINKLGYKKKYLESLKNNDKFWEKEGKRITWINPYTKIKDVKFSKKDVNIKWFYDGTLNASVNCIDRHLKKIKIKLLLFG